MGSVTLELGTMAVVPLVRSWKGKGLEVDDVHTLRILLVTFVMTPTYHRG